MSIEAVFSNICGRLNKAVKFHCQMIEYFEFLGLKGFSEIHKYQLFSEKAELVKTKEYYIENYNLILNDNTNDSSKYIPDNWVGVTRFDLEGGQKALYVKEALETWAEWESESKKFYENRYCDAYDLHEVDACRYIAELIADVSNEVKRADELIIRLKGTSWDCARIDEMQDKLYKEYCKKIEKIGREIK